MLSAADDVLAVWSPVAVPESAIGRLEKSGSGPTPVGAVPGSRPPEYDELVGMGSECTAVTHTATLRSLALPVVMPGAVMVLLAKVALQVAVPLSNGVAPT